jgi:Protein of unknown function (DUF3300)
MKRLPRFVQIGCAVVVAGAMVLAQEAPPPAAPPAPPATAPAQILTPDQLDTLVAPVALYPDPLLGQILAASTYPLEVVEANQWLQQNKGLSGQQLLDAARQQNWDASVQALVAFPDVLARLNQDIRWTTDLGNAFLAQQPEVMAAVQRMRARAQVNGKLQSNSQETVTTQNENGQSAIEIEPANPQVVYVPVYNPEWVWGPPVWGVYPPLFYPGIGVGLSFWPGIYVGGFFGGCCGWGAFGWGWGFNWFGHSLLVNNYFLHRYGFADFHGGAFRGTAAWAHDPAHRLGVPYANRGVAARFGAASRAGRVPEARGFEGRTGGFEGRTGGFEGRAPEERFGSQGFERGNPGANHSVFGGIHNGGQTRMENDHGFSTMHGGGFGGGGFRGGGGGGFHGGGGGGHRGR